jgi:alkylhydroperoxidase family enzyme
MLTSEEAWQRLPGAPETVQPLPAWARMLVGPLPLTTARMLELDALHRTGKRLDAKLRGLVRWSAADANGCPYAKAVAIADLRRGGVSETDLQALLGDLSGTARESRPTERASVDFARKMMREAHTVTDDEVKQLLSFLGEEQVVALVALLAHASYQDRIFLVANVQVEPGGVLPPLTVSFARPRQQPPTSGMASTPTRSVSEGRITNPSYSVSEAPTPTQRATDTSPTRQRGEVNAGQAAAGTAWLDLQKQMEVQRARVGRIRVPSRAEVLARLGENHPAAWQADILWSRVCYGFQPELTDAWFACTAAFRQEARLDRVFEQRIFWEVTRSLQCFY